jgi:hypothetical protein
MRAADAGDLIVNLNTQGNDIIYKMLVYRLNQAENMPAGTFR